MKDLEYTQYFDQYALTSDVGKSLEGGEKSNNDLYHTVHVDIPSY